jgi:DNA-binding NarL/FixJ family response regulator
MPLSIANSRGLSAPAAAVTRDAVQSAGQQWNGALAADQMAAVFGPRWSLDRLEHGGRAYLVAVRSRGSLSPRETQVVDLVALGHSNKVISYELGLAWSTVRVLVFRACRKLGVRKRAELEACLRGSGSIPGLEAGGARPSPRRPAGPSASNSAELCGP